MVDNTWEVLCISCSSRVLD